MNTSQQLAKHFRDVHFGGNWTCSNLKDQLADLGWEEAVKKVYGLNTIAMLTFHVNYYVDAIIKVLKGGELDAHDKYSYDCLPIHSQEDWEKIRDKALAQAEEMTELITQLPEEKLQEFFTNEKYGTYIRNMLGVIEHTHYHLGQIAIIKKIVRSMAVSH